MAKIMQPNVLEVCPGADAGPDLRGSEIPTFAAMGRKDLVTSFQPFLLGQDLQCTGVERKSLLPSLGVR